MRPETKVTYIISDIDKALAFEWVATYIDRQRFTLSFILLNPGPSELHRFLEGEGFEVYTVICRGKKDWPAALLQTGRLLRRMGPQVVHCHLIQANTIGLLAAALTGIRKRIYTRHHSSLHHTYFPKGVWWDKLANRLATDIIAISTIVQKILVDWEGVPPRKVHLVPHGFLLHLFKQVPQTSVQAFRDRHRVNGKRPVIGVISRFTEWKGVQYIIPAFKRYLEGEPDSLLLLLNAKGDHEAPIRQLLAELPEDSYRCIPFEKDVAAAYAVMDAFVHVPVDEHSEAFGQIYVEALAAGVPSVFTRSGVANDERFNDSTVFLVGYRDSDDIFRALRQIREQPAETARRIAAGKALAEAFDLPIFIGQLEKLYYGA